MSAIEFTNEKVSAAYAVADDKTKKAVLAALFGDAAIKPTPTLDDYKTIQDYEDACNALQEIPLDEKALQKAKVPSHLIALMKLETISRALWGKNFEPMPDAEGNKYFYYPYFALYTKQEIKNMDDEQRGSLLSAHAYVGAGAGFGVLFTNNRSSHANASLGFRLCQETSEKATYFGRQFINLWAEYVKFNFTIEEVKK